jgi:predicted fused transcriptional regulator/phosphomethylpyrimidine kinase
MADKFVKMTKDGETIEVHPSVVEDHKHLGWKVVEVQAKTETAEAKAAEKKAAAEAKAAEAKAIVDSKGTK